MLTLHEVLLTSEFFEGKGIGHEFFGGFLVFFNSPLLASFLLLLRGVLFLAEAFFAGADLLIHDAQYTQKEYNSSKVGWGHSSFEHAIAAAKRAGVKRLALFHHEPVRTDSEIDELTEKYCNPGYSGNTEVFFAREGMEIEL